MTSSISTVSVRGCDLVVDDGGPDASDGSSSRTPVIWGHGLTSSRAAEDAFALVDTVRLRRTRRVVRYDARGHGESGDLVEHSDGEWDRLALDQVELLDHLGIDEVVVGGASMGAATALHAAPLLGERLRALVLVIPPTAWATRAAQTDRYDTLADIVESRGIEALVAAASALPPPDPFAASVDEYRRRRAASFRRAGATRLAAAFRGARGADLPPVAAVRAIAVPTLVLAWTGDAGHPVETADRLAELLPNAERSIASTADDLAAWTDLVEAFLADL